MPPKQAHRDLNGWELLAKLPDELKLSYRIGSETFERSLYSSSAYISREECFRLSMRTPEVSQFHAQIEWDDKTRKWKIKDLDSTGGTKVNGRKVRSDRCTGLKDGDVISISGVVTVKVEVGDLALTAHTYVNHSFAPPLCTATSPI